MKKILLISLVCSIIILAIESISAHDLWLVPQKFRITPGETQAIFANTGMDFPNSLSPVTPDRVNQFILLGKFGGGILLILKFKVTL